MTLFLVTLLTFASAEGAAIGTKAPVFEVRSGDDKVLNLDMVRGKVVVLFHETKDVSQENRKLKNELKAFYQERTDAEKGLIVKLPIINCSGAFFPFTGIWRSKLRENSIKEAVTIYGDWNGKMAADYNMKDGASNVLIIDKRGIIRYFSSGVVASDEINRVKELLKRLAAEE
jgi:peroxiredoxin